MYVHKKPRHKHGRMMKLNITAIIPQQFLHIKTNILNYHPITLLHPDTDIYLVIYIQHIS